jgi:hypothetical protein
VVATEASVHCWCNGGRGWSGRKGVSCGMAAGEVQDRLWFLEVDWD